MVNGSYLLGFGFIANFLDLLSMFLVMVLFLYLSLAFVLNLVLVLVSNIGSSQRTCFAQKGLSIILFVN